MRVLIGFNGSRASRDALDDLRYAGLPDEAEVHILTVAESWLSPKTLNEARLVSEEGASIVTSRFRKWKVSSNATKGSPPRELLSQAENLRPDLIVLGESPQQTDHHSMFLGQTSQIVLTESSCSVRIARKSTPDEESERILVGFNGSPAAMLAVDSVVSRSWHPSAEVKLIAVADSSVLGSIGRFTPQMTDSVIEEKFAHQWAETLADVALGKLKQAGIRASLQVAFGHPKEIISNEAERWNANSIFVGPHCSLNSYERFLIGSVSAALAARANCSVEIVRPSAPHS
jgi:nucleotide-binding universal stress UspA family protein